MTQEPQRLQSDDVIWLASGEPPFVINYKTFLSGDFLKSLNQQCKKIDYSSSVEVRNQWFASGMDCEVLQPNKDWQKGKVRICIEFIPDVDEEEEPSINEETEEVETEASPLDEIRKIAKDGA